MVTIIMFLRLLHIAHIPITLNFLSADKGEVYNANKAGFTRLSLL